jgi:hypothetical protein
MKDYYIIVSFNQEPSTEFVNGYMAGRAAERLDREASIIKSYHEKTVAEHGTNEAINDFRFGGNTATGDRVVKGADVLPAKKEVKMVIETKSRKPVVGRVYAFNNTATDLREVVRVWENGDVAWKRRRVVGSDSGNRHLSGSMSAATWRTVCKGAYVEAM